MASTHDLDRRLYRGGRPSRFARAVNGAWAHAAAHGLAPARMSTLEVRGRRSGRTIALPVVVAQVGAQRYLVAMLGEQAGWVRNVRAADGEAVLRRGRREPVRLVEVPVAERAPILREYLAAAPGARAHIPVDPAASLPEFARVAQRFPVFRVDERDAPAPPS